MILKTPTERRTIASLIARPHESDRRFRHPVDEPVRADVVIQQ